MKKLSLAPLLLLAACATQPTTTPVAKLALPATTTIEGTATKITKEGFILTDSTGKIEVDVEVKKGQKQPVKKGQNVIVVGYLDAEGEFEAVEIRKQPENKTVFQIDLPQAKK